jgi:sigma-B regulation protein RsbU (phosphoserine phosphatase)
MPSYKVGGDLVDVVELADGDTVAYLADIAGHGLQAGILMGMLKTAARMALLDGTRNQGGGTLSMLMERLNRVLPGVKEAHMYATFSALRLNLDGQAFYGLAASPPLLHWRAAQKDIVRIEEEQFPLALLPVAGFTASPLGMAPGDVVLIATDGISEVCSKTGVEFGTERLETLMTNHVGLPLGDLAAFIFEAVRNYGKQLDDQTLLMVRRSLVEPGAIDRQFHVVNS